MAHLVECLSANGIHSHTHLYVCICMSAFMYLPKKLQAFQIKWHVKVLVVTLLRTRRCRCRCRSRRSAECCLPHVLISIFQQMNENELK